MLMVIRRFTLPLGAQLFIISLGCAGCFFAAYTILQWRAAHAAAFFSEALHAAEVYEAVEVGGNVYRVNRGDVSTINGGRVEGAAALRPLALAYAAALARRAPLLSLAGTDPEELARAVDTLSEAEKGFLPVQSTQRERGSIAALYPIDFLRALAYTEKTRLAFLAQPNEINEKAYENAQRDAVRQYVKNLSDFKSAFVSMVPVATAEYGVWGGIVSRESSLASIDALVQGMHTTARRLAERRMCLGGDTNFCGAADLRIPTLSTDAGLSSQYVSLPLLQELRTVFAKATEDATYKTAPAVLLQDATCISDPSVAPLILLHTKTLHDGPTIYDPRFIGDVMLQDAAEFAKTVPYFAYYTDRGVRYVRHGLLNNYQCVTFGTDFGRIAAIWKVITTATKDPFSAYATGQEVATLRKLEREVTPTAQNIVRESDVHSYVNEALSVFSKTGDPEQLNKAISLERMLLDRSAGADSLVYGIASLEENDQRLGEAGLPVRIDASYLFFARSGFFTLFMGGNGSIADAYVPPYAAGDILASSTLPFIPYSSLNKAARESAAHDIGFFHDLHDPTSCATPPSCSLP